MIPLVLRKIARNPWLALSLAAGVLLAVATASGIPQYTEGVLESHLHTSLAEREASGDLHAGSIVARTTLWRYGGQGESVETLPELERSVARVMEFGLPVLARSRLIGTGPFFVRDVDGRPAAGAGTMLTLELIEGLEGRIRRIGLAGVAPQGGAGPIGSADHPLPVLLAEDAAGGLDLRAGERYLLVGAQAPLTRELWVRLEGSFIPLDPREPFWVDRYGGSRPILYVAADAVDDAAVAGFGFPRVEVEWLCVVDHASLTVRSLASQLRILEARHDELSDLGVSSSTPLTGILSEFRERERAIRVTLLFLQVPLWLLLLLFIADASAILVRHDRTEISVLMSRGASGAQVLGIYAGIAAAIAVCGIAMGPPLGMLAGRIFGSTAGFLSFVRRERLPVGLGLPAYATAALASLLFAAIMLPPAVSASRVTIVAHRRSGSGLRRPLWKRAFLDLLLLAVSAYGLYGGATRGRILELTGATPGELPLDPLLFVSSILFLLGSSLLAVRLFPFAIGLVRRAGFGFRGVVAHAALLHLAREPAGRDSSMLFLVFTVAVGVFSASTARTMNRHFEDAIRQRIGADLTVAPQWLASAAAPAVAPATGAPEARGSAVPDAQPGEPRAGSFAMASSTSFATAEGVRLSIAAAAGGEGESAARGARSDDELEVCRSLPGVERATWVLRVGEATAVDMRSDGVRAALMGVTPSEFGRVAWSRRDLYPTGFARLLNALASRQDGLLVSRTLAVERGLRQGDRLSLSWGERSSATGIVRGVFDYWPGHDPRDPAGVEGRLVVANLPYLDAMTEVGAREIWLRREPAASRGDFYAALRDSGLSLVQLDDAESEIARSRASPFVRGINGVLTLAFLASVLVCVAGLAMHTVVSLRGRTLELGVERATGLSRMEVTSALALEHSLMLIVSIAAGTLLGGAGGQLFIPLLQTATGAAERIIPFVVGAARQDYRNVWVFAAGVLASSLGVLGLYVRRLHVAETLKLGEQ